VNPHLPTFRKAGFGGYYWVADQVEVATDIAFGTRPGLDCSSGGVAVEECSAFGSADGHEG
jgi:hypothetical protein